MEEKQYTFLEYSSGQEDPVEIIVKESQLTASQKELLLGEIIQHFNSLPEKLKQRFISHLTQEMVDRMNLKVYKELGYDPENILKDE